MNCHAYLGHFDTSRGMPASLEGVLGHRDKSMSNGHGKSRVSQQEERSVRGIKFSKLLSKLPLAFLALVCPAE